MKDCVGCTFAAYVYFWGFKIGALKFGALKFGLLEGRGEALPKNLYTPLCHWGLLPCTPFL